MNVTDVTVQVEVADTRASPCFEPGRDIKHFYINAIHINIILDPHRKFEF